MKYIALTGPAGSGKTTLAKALEREGYQHLNFTDFLKQLACEVVKPLVTLTLEDIRKNKAKYRGFLQEFGDLIDFTGNPAYINAILGSWVDDPFPCCFDNIRSSQQAEYLRNLGFTVVKLVVSDDILTARGQVITESQKQHPIESGIPNELVDVVLNGFLPINELTSIIRGQHVEDDSREKYSGLGQRAISQRTFAAFSAGQKGDTLF